MTSASGKPYAGSFGSVSTAITSVSNGSTLTDGTTSTIMTSRGPLRSSLKKPRPRPQPGNGDDFSGFQNPGFHGSSNSPRMDRKGSIKKVRIQTHSTEV
jgi:hypothetical protein